MVRFSADTHAAMLAVYLAHGGRIPLAQKKRLAHEWRITLRQVSNWVYDRRKRFFLDGTPKPRRARPAANRPQRPAPPPPPLPQQNWEQDPFAEYLNGPLPDWHPFGLPVWMDPLGVFPNLVLTCLTGYHWQYNDVFFPQPNQ